MELERRVKMIEENMKKDIIEELSLETFNEVKQENERLKKIINEELQPDLKKMNGYKDMLDRLLTKEKLIKDFGIDFTENDMLIPDCFKSNKPFIITMKNIKKMMESKW